MEDEVDDSWLGSTLSVCPMKKRCLLDATSMSTTREWQGYTTLSSSAPNSTCQTRESIMDGRSHAYTKSHGGHLVSHGLATRLLHTLYMQGRAVEACYLICAAPFTQTTHTTLPHPTTLYT